MTVAQLKEALELEILVKGSMDNRISGCYCGDLLSWVMSHAQSGDAWVTVMGNVNSIAVAALADVSCIILSEDAVLDEDAREKASEQKIPVLRSFKNTYKIATEIHSHLLTGFLQS